MRTNVRRLFAVATLSATICSLSAIERPSLHAADIQTKGKLTQKSLGQLLTALGLKPKALKSRYDFRFKANHDEEWELSMSAVLSNDGDTIWIMAWLDELPRSAREVPRVALLRLLADNDKMGGGKFFAYIPGTRRFILQRVVANQNVTTKKFRSWLVDLGQTVSGTHGHWSVAGWTQKPKKSGAKNVSGTSPDSTKQATPSSGTARRVETRAKTPR